MAFIPLIINIVFSNNRITAGRQGRATTTASDAPVSKSNKSSFISTEVEPSILLLFGLLLFSMATGIKLKL